MPNPECIWFRFCRINSPDYLNKDVFMQAHFPLISENGLLPDNYMMIHFLF
jgi:hypothetical protein